MLTASRVVCRTSNKCIGCNGRECKNARARAKTHTAARIRHASESVQTCFFIPIGVPLAVCAARLQVRCSLIGLQNAAHPRPLLPPSHHSPFAAVLRRRPCRRDPITLSSSGAARHLQRRASRRRRVACHCYNPCLGQVGHPSTMHRPCAPCLVQLPRAAGRGLQP